jgi:hypothetical protein
MKKVIIALLAACLLNSCTDKKAQEKIEEKGALDSILTIHDKVMGKEEQLVKNKSELDSLIKNKLVPDVMGATSEISQSLGDADNKMMTWMHQFDAEHTGKTHEDIMNYLKDQKKQLSAIDSLMDMVIMESGKDLKEFKKK